MYAVTKMVHRALDGNGIADHEKDLPKWRSWGADG
jgi:hypothetical protein